MADTPNPKHHTPKHEPKGSGSHDAAHPADSKPAAPVKAEAEDAAVQAKSATEQTQKASDSAAERNKAAETLITRYEKLFSAAKGGQMPSQLERAELNALAGDVRDIASAPALPGVPAGITPEAQAEIDKWKEAAQRIKADFLNYQDRARHEREQLSEFALKTFIETLLPVIDNFRHSLAKAAEQKQKEKTQCPAFDAFFNAIALIHQSFQEILRGQGIEAVDKAGAPFDPEIHEAIACIPAPAVPNGCVVEVTRVGYLWNGKLLRPAQVVVAENPEKKT